MTGHEYWSYAYDQRIRLQGAVPPILDRVHETGERVVILKRGRPVAELSRVTGDGNDYPQADLEGTVIVVDDVVGPVFPEEHWDSLKR